MTTLLVFDRQEFSYFDLQVTLMLPTKFGVNWPFGSGEVAKKKKKKKKKKKFQDGGHGGHLGFPIGTILAIFDVQIILILPAKYRVNWPRGVGGVGNCWRRTTDYARRRWTTHDGHWLTTIAHHEHFVLRWANKGQKHHEFPRVFYVFRYTFSMRNLEELRVILPSQHST